MSSCGTPKMSLLYRYSKEKKLLDSSISYCGTLKMLQGLGGSTKNN